MPDQRIVNASPLILLARAGHFDLLRFGANRVVVPDAVITEILAHGPHDPAASAVQAASWLERVSNLPLSALVAAWDLGAGESAVIDWAMAHIGAEAILDDRAARRCAQVVGVSCRGTLGLVLAAKRGGRINAARPVVTALRDAGMYATDQFVAASLALVGE